MSVRIRPEIAALPRYRPGRPPKPGNGPAYKLSSNENPYPPLPSVLAAVADAAAELNRYPDFGAVALTEAIAAHHGVGVDRVALGTGSVAVAQSAVSAVAGPGDEVVYAWRSFEAYPIITAIAGATAVPVPLRDERHDLSTMAAAITDRTRLVLLCSPNNPTGAAITRDEFDRFAVQVPADCLIVLDEAYAEFVTDPAAVDGLHGPSERPNVAVLRTFSKAYGLASLRVGYAIAAAPVADALRAVATPFGVSSVAQAAAIASLAAGAELAERVDAIVAERSRLTAGLRRRGFDPAPSEANFVWLRLGDEAASLATACETAGVSVRAFPGEGVRITVDEPAATERLLDAVGKIVLSSGAWDE